uniref:SH2 domain-containing protein n=1 Tax=Hydatigena taeniaeformis TaxID=6205 RepID=A0A0R3WU71_HYDTA
LIVCYQRYCSSDTPEISSKYEIERDWYETEKPDSMSKDSTESLQASATPMIRLQPPNCADSFLPKLEHKTSSRTSDSSKSLGTTHPKFKHKCLLVDGFDAEESCPHSTDSSGGYGEHSVSWVSRPSKTGKGSRDMESPSRSRRRDRFYRFLPIFIRRHTLSRKKDKIPSDEDFGLSDNEASRMKARFPSTSPKRLQRPYESLTLDRINYIKKSDLAKLHRTPLQLSTSALFNTGDGDATSTGTSTLRRHQHWRGDEMSQRPPLLYTVACQNGVCVSCKTTEMEQSIIEWVDVRKCGKKMQVGKSFIAQDFNVVGEKHSTDEEVGEVVGKDYTQISHVYANIDPQDAYPLEQPTAGVTLYDIGIQADLPNRLRGLRCRLEFEQPGVELGDRGQLSCEAFKERFDPLSLKTVEREDGKGGRGEADRDFKTLSFRVAFNNKPARSASTI